MKLCVIGAGAAGLCAAKHGIDYGLEVTVFEQTDQIGGTWVYTDEVGKDKNGLDVHSSMYQGLLTNLPKDVMGYPSRPFPDGDTSYITSDEVLKYYQSYADEFNLLRYVKLEHYVIRVRPIMDKLWEVIVQDLKTKNFCTYAFDLLFVCNGHYSTPSLPAYKGQEIFKGKQIHSHDFRSAEKFSGKRVLIIGAGFSAMDGIKDCRKFAEHVTWSHHLEKSPNLELGENVSQKPDIKEIKSCGVVFVDGSYQDFSVILYCTGYKYSFPFVSVDCGVRCDDNYVRPLYKHCLSINNPSLAFIGLPNYTCPNQVFDLQVRFCLTFMTGRKQLPEKGEMLEDLERDENLRKERGIPRRNGHFMGQVFHDEYSADLAATAEITPIKPVITKMFHKSLCFLMHDYKSLRKEVFKVIDDENFVLLKN